MLLSGGIDEPVVLFQALRQAGGDYIVIWVQRDIAPKAVHTELREDAPPGLRAGQTIEVEVLTEAEDFSFPGLTRS